MNLLLVIIIAISLSMDAFSLSLAFGTNNLEKKNMIILSITVGIFHFFMPILGNFFGSIILSFIKVRIEVVLFIIFLYIGINMLKDVFKKENKTNIKNIIELLLFALAVSLDSFSIGIGIKGITNNMILACSCFCLFSLMFTYLGLKLGSNMYYKFGNKANVLGSVILILLAIIQLFK